MVELEMTVAVDLCIVGSHVISSSVALLLSSVCGAGEKCRISGPFGPVESKPAF